MMCIVALMSTLLVSQLKHCSSSFSLLICRTMVAMETTCPPFCSATFTLSEHQVTIVYKQSVNL